MMPPIIGAAIRFIPSAPVPVDHMIGRSPMPIVATVITFGRNRLTAPSMIARCSAVTVPSRRPRRASSYAIEIQQHEDAGLSIDADERDQADPDADAHVVAEQV